MEQLIIPQADTIPVAWGWFQLLLLVTFPLHLLAMNAMVGGLLVGILQHIQGGKLQRLLAHRIAIALPLVIAFVVNFGVAPLLFVQVLYGQFMYSSSILMGSYWILVVPILIVAYYGAYLYDFKFKQLGGLGPVIAILVFTLILVIGFVFSNNMLLMVLPEHFDAYFSTKDGSLLATGHAAFWPRYLHMMAGSVAVGGLFVGLVGLFKKSSNPKLAAHAKEVGLRIFMIFTVINVVLGLWYFLSLPRAQMKIFMGGHLGATLIFLVALVAVGVVLWAGYKKKFRVVLLLGIALVFLMSFMRSWLRSSYLAEHFSLDQLPLSPQYSPLILFLVTFAMGILAIVWLLKVTSSCLAGD